MAENENDQEISWKPRVLLIGGIIGCISGIIAAYLLIQRAEKEGSSPQLTAGEGVKLGALLFGLLRQITLLGS
ncbi:MAG: hypothetical protein WCI88_09175 [Chloroflexota bacterium]|jgi:hypothetical protein